MSSLTAMTHIVQVSIQLDELHQKLNDVNPISNDTILTISSQMQPLYKKLLITNLDDALSKQLETALWHDCFKTPLTKFGRTDKSLFHLMIETGVGFYLGLIQDIGIHFDISFITNTTSTNKLYCTKTSQSPLVSPSKASVYYIIQNCLLHVGDLLRYRGSFPEALKMYEKSAAVSPTNGHPYHQMAVTQQLIVGNDDYTTMNNLVSIFYYFSRSLGVSSPHYSSNASFLEYISNKLMGVKQGSGKYTEFIRQFLLTIAATIPEIQMEPTGLNVMQSLSPLLTNQQIKPSIIFQAIIICLYAHWRTTTVNKFDESFEELSLELITGILNSLMIATSALHGGSSEDENSLLVSNNVDKRWLWVPHVKLLMDWLSRIHQSEHSGRRFAYIRDKLHIGNIASILNHITSCQQFDEEFSMNFILPEEKKLIGFLPLDYSVMKAAGGCLLDDSSPRSIKLRLFRLIQYGKKLSTPNANGQILLESDGSYFYEPMSLSPIKMPSKRNVALTSIFRSQTQTTTTPVNTGPGARSSPAISPFACSVNSDSPSNPQDLFRSIWTPDDENSPVKGDSSWKTDLWP